MRNIRIFDTFKTFVVFFIIASLFFAIVGITRAQDSTYTPPPNGGQMTAASCSSQGGTWMENSWCQFPVPPPSGGCGGAGQPACSSGSYTTPYPSGGCGGAGQPACTGSYSGTSGTSVTSGNGNWVKHSWQFIDGVESSYILNRTDQEYQDFIARTHAKCVMTPRSNLAWKPSSGNDASSNWQNFGIPECPGGGTTTGTMPYISPAQPVGTIGDCVNRKISSDLSRKMSSNYSSLTSDERRIVEEANRTCNQEMYPQSQMYSSQPQPQPYNTTPQVTYPQPQQQPEMMNQQPTQSMQDSSKLQKCTDEAKRIISSGQVLQDKFDYMRDSCMSRTGGGSQSSPDISTPEYKVPNEMSNYQGNQCNVKDFQRGAKQMEKDVKNLSNKIKKFTKSGMTVSQELQANLQELNNIIAQIKSITKCQEISDIGQEKVPEIMQNIYEGINNLERLNQVPKMIKKARGDVKKMDRQYAKIESNAARKNMNISAILLKIKADIDALKKNLDDATLTLKAGDAEATNEYMQDFFDGTQPVWDSLNQAESIFNISKFVKNAQQEIKQMEREIKSFKLKRIDTTDMSVILQEAKNWVSEIQLLMKSGISDADDAFDLMDRGNDIRQEYNEARQDAMNYGSEEEQIMKNTKKQLPFLERLLPRLEIPMNLLKALVRPAK